MWLAGQLSTIVTRHVPDGITLSVRLSSTFKATSPQLFQMGWFGSNTPEPTAVSREGRQHCWDNRDAYFACLDNANVLKPGDEGKACTTEKAAYEMSCAKSWVRCFPLAFLRQSRVQVAFLDRILQ